MIMCLGVGNPFVIDVVSGFVIVGGPYKRYFSPLADGIIYLSLSDYLEVTVSATLQLKILSQQLLQSCQDTRLELA